MSIRMFASKQTVLEIIEDGVVHKKSAILLENTYGFIHSYGYSELLEEMRKDGIIHINGKWIRKIYPISDE